MLRKLRQRDRFNGIRLPYADSVTTAVFLFKIPETVEHPRQETEKKRRNTEAAKERETAETDGTAIPRSGETGSGKQKRASAEPRLRNGKTAERETAETDGAAIPRSTSSCPQLSSRRRRLLRLPHLLLAT